MKTSTLKPKIKLVLLLLASCALLVVPAYAEDAPHDPMAAAKIFAGEVPQDLKDLKAMQLHIQQLAEKVIPCTVGVRVGQAQGSGVIISKDGYVLTAGHVVGRPKQNVVFIFPDGSTKKGKTLGMNRGIDSGLMKIEDEGEYPFLEMGNSSELKDGQWLIGTGHPGGYINGRSPVLRLGRVISNDPSVIRTDCTLVGGDSGGPLFDMDGKVVGIHSRIGGQLSSNMHVPVKTYSDTWDRLVKAESWGNTTGNAPFIGVVGDEEASDCRISEVYPDTPAAKAGIEEGDVIVQFDGKDVTDFESLKKLVVEKSPGNKVKVKIRRSEETKELELIIGRRAR